MSCSSGSSESIVHNYWCSPVTRYKDNNHNSSFTTREAELLKIEGAFEHYFSLFLPNKAGFPQAICQDKETNPSQQFLPLRSNLWAHISPHSTGCLKLISQLSFDSFWLWRAPEPGTMTLCVSGAQQKPFASN